MIRNRFLSFYFSRMSPHIHIHTLSLSLSLSLSLCLSLYLSLSLSNKPREGLVIQHVRSLQHSTLLFQSKTLFIELIRNAFFLPAPLPNLTSDDIDRALAPASSQGYNAPSPSLYDSRQHASAPSVVPKSSDYNPQGRSYHNESFDRSTPSWVAPSPTPSK